MQCYEVLSIKEKIQVINDNVVKFIQIKLVNWSRKSSWDKRFTRMIMQEVSIERGSSLQSKHGGRRMEIISRIIHTITVASQHGFLSTEWLNE